MLILLTQWSPGPLRVCSVPGAVPKHFRGRVGYSLTLCAGVGTWSTQTALQRTSANHSITTTYRTSL